MSLIGNMSITVYKVGLGIVGNSKALIADGVHSFTDVIGTAVIITCRGVAERPPDETHAYGYAKVEFMGAAFIYSVLLVIGALIFWSGVDSMIHYDGTRPHLVTLLGGAVSVLYNVIMYSYGQCAGKKNNSPAILANSYENRADAISSVAVMIGIAASLVIHPLCDPIGAVIVGVIIFVNAIEQMREAIGGLMDRALPLDENYRIRQLALATGSVTGIDFVRSRQLGSDYWVDIGVFVPPTADVASSDRVAASVRSALMRSSEMYQNVEVFVAAEPNQKTDEQSDNDDGGSSG